MMTIRQYYLNKLMEECVEVAQRAAKQMQFGPLESQAKGPGQTKTGDAELNNMQRLRKEVNDLLGVLDVLADIGELPEISPWELLEAKNEKRHKMAKYLDYAQRLGNVENIGRPVGLKIHDTYSIEPEPDATGECQLTYGADDICGLPAGAHCSFSHKFVPKS